MIYERKRLFIGLLIVSLLAVCMLAVAIWYLVFSPESSVVYKLVLLAVDAVLIIAILLAGFGLAGIVLTLVRSKPLALLQGPVRVALNTFFPLVLILGKLLSIDLNRIKRSFIEVNNNLVRAMHISAAPDQLLLLAPHCLQSSTCTHKVTGNVDNCRRCGQCMVSDLLRLRDHYGIRVGMATGGTLARKYVRDYRPKAIVAIACERDLTSGILDANPIPVLGVTNLRPHGPCHDTQFSYQRVDEAIQYFLRNGSDCI
ncbi:DUF116 domain-containing protein [Desulfoscipio gibsoniae]|uniref:DUF116 domain-containing protein n=1 Tax=Desulfoscipio gibsoniae DSM 7213 TaxID=767817 RepID=R4KKZ0_9FIRM|nr:DUF116 domain-containing protein [Desulfoscipio gibsoniae]AGL02242.1 hypothetical protein Desgi_2841 [Desulfoscipio gibsoniae DSM 7213]